MVKCQVLSVNLTGLMHSDKETGFFPICDAPTRLFVKTRFLSPHGKSYKFHYEKTEK
jgi:hypothetical protein